MEQVLLVKVLEQEEAQDAEAAEAEWAATVQVPELEAIVSVQVAEQKLRTSEVRLVIL
jgi:hypothetical protein